MIAVGYLRVSSEEQSRSGLGLQAQRATIEAEIERRACSVIWIEDRAASGKDMKRPGMQRALTMLKSSQATTLIAAKLDRISRSVFDFAALLQRADKEAWSVVALDIGIDSTTANGKLVAHIMASVADWERQRISERTREALGAARARGKRLGGPRTISDDLRRRVVVMRSDGLTLQAIADRLNDEQVSTARGGLWQRGTVHALLRSAALDEVTV